MRRETPIYSAALVDRARFSGEKEFLPPGCLYAIGMPDGYCSILIETLHEHSYNLEMRCSSNSSPQSLFSIGVVFDAEHIIGIDIRFITPVFFHEGDFLGQQLGKILSVDKRRFAES